MSTAKLRAMYSKRQVASKDAGARGDGETGKTGAPLLERVERAQLCSLLEADDVRDPEPRKLGKLTRNIFVRQHKIKEFVAEAKSIVKELAPPNQGDVDTRSVQEWPNEGRKVAEAVDPAVHAKVT